MLLPIVMLASGVANTILSKYQDNLAEDAGPIKSMAIFQSLNIFLGEACLWFYVFYRRYSRGSDYESLEPLTLKEKAALALPAIMDISGSTLMNVGLLFTSASIYQMTRGSLIIFVALFSITFLKRYIGRNQWLSLAFVVLGVTIVGYSGFTSNVGSNPTLGISAVLIGQGFLAVQFTLEEYILSYIHVDPPELVAYEGTYGVVFVLLGMALSYYFVGSTEAGRYGWFDYSHVFSRLNESCILYFISFVIMISIAFFNVSGLSITQIYSATTRSLLDIGRTFGIWIIALLFGMESFHLLQFTGFVLLIYGIATYHSIIKLPLAEV
ncbi:Golgi UDP-galactose transmembrane transporter Gms2 [Schizosaccharomyces osmophilus]|uniref:Golgi UDP-galactose transmembrane transporter Gms2 n=1 Tax=Schizosaccharomyces osmophilus TaxID=2545709 RepID=A0AAE9WEN1_9SCHI|nr:Golgi UDP-galactose transmembrane transporter Gms2 [Schizosaccharomyces osmophilus]WBW73851.1 Golgi UDP-galactose transmembrane transporter Gms2 [Schizosaccharomyces osmophilus]